MPYLHACQHGIDRNIECCPWCEGEAKRETLYSCCDRPARLGHAPDCGYRKEDHQRERLPTDAAVRKAMPIARGVLDYFPDALAAIAEVSRVGNEQHNPGQPMHWARDKSTDHADCIVRHLIDRGAVDTDGLRHTAKVAWRALALLQTELEEAAEKQAEPYDPA